MALPRLTFVLLAAAILGVAVPAVFLAASWSGHYFFGSTFDLCLWPTSIMLMATENHGRDLFANSVLVVSVLANVVYYSLIASLLWCVLRIGRAALARVRTRKV